MLSKPVAIIIGGKVIQEPADIGAEASERPGFVGTHPYGPRCIGMPKEVYPLLG
jgi:hypothetical protein